MAQQDNTQHFMAQAAQHCIALQATNHLDTTRDVRAQQDNTQHNTTHDGAAQNCIALQAAT